MKIAISGKGGVGKTTLSAGLINAYAITGYKILAVDADSDGNLAEAIGLPQELIQNITPIIRMKELIYERTGMAKDTDGFFKLNPKVDDLLDRFGVMFNNIRFLAIGGIDRGASGCMCPANTLLKSLMQYILMNNRYDMVILDMEAGIEHMGRATACFVDAFIVVVEPGQRSIQTAKNIQILAKDIGVNNIMIVANKVRNDKDNEIIVNSLPDTKMLGYISYNEELIDMDLMKKDDISKRFMDEIYMIKDALNEAIPGLAD
jgi:CO dehydrogenase maturation factor